MPFGNRAFCTTLKTQPRATERTTIWRCNNENIPLGNRAFCTGAIHSTKIQTGPTGKRGPPQKVDLFFRNFSGWTEPIHWVLDRNFQKFWLNGSRPTTLKKQPRTTEMITIWWCSKTGIVGHVDILLNFSFFVLIINKPGRYWKGQ